MMHIYISTNINADFETVVQHFNQHLLEKVSPAFPPTRLLRYDGNQPGDEVHVELNFLFFRQVWVSWITHYEKNAERMVFIDKGKRLPFFLSYWQHEHRVEKSDSVCCIVDDIMFKGTSRWMSYVLYPLMYLQFKSRQPRYRKYFNQL